MGARGIALGAAAILAGGLVSCSPRATDTDSPDAAGLLVIEDATGDTWHTRRNGSYEQSQVTTNVDLARTEVLYTPRRLSFVLIYAQPLEPGAGAFGSQVGVAYSETTDEEMVVTWSSDHPRRGEALSSTAGPVPLCHPTASADFEGGRVTIVVPVGHFCLPRRPQPQRLQVRRAATWADGGFQDSLFSREAYGRGDDWVDLTDGP